MFLYYFCDSILTRYHCHHLHQWVSRSRLISCGSMQNILQPHCIWYAIWFCMCIRWGRTFFCTKIWFGEKIFCTDANADSCLHDLPQRRDSDTISRLQRHTAYRLSHTTDEN